MKKFFLSAIALLSCIGVEVMAKDGVLNSSGIQKGVESLSVSTNPLNQSPAKAASQQSFKYWDFVFSESTLNAIRENLYMGYWEEYGTNLEEGSVYTLYCYEEIKESFMFYVDLDNFSYIEIPETSGLILGRLNEDWGMPFVSIFPEIPYILFESTCNYFKIPGLTAGMKVVINYKSARKYGTETAENGFTCLTGNAEFSSGSETNNTNEFVDVVYTVVEDGDVAFAPLYGNETGHAGMLINSISVELSDDAMAVLRQEVYEYMATLTDYPGLKAELTAAYNESEIAEDASSEEIQAALAALNDVYAQVKLAVENFELMSLAKSEAEEILETTEVDYLVEALNVVNALDVNTFTSAEYNTAYNQLVAAIMIYKSSQIPMEDWAFNTSSFITVDGLRYYIDETNHLAEFIGLPNSNMPQSSLNIPVSIKYNEQEYIVVAMINRYQNSQSYIETVSLPSTLRSIGQNAFLWFSNLKYLEIPAEVTHIAYNAFSGCNNLLDIKLLAATPPVCAGSLGTNSKTKIHIPDGTFHAYRLASQWNTYIIITETPVEVIVDIADAGDLGRLILEEAGYLQEVNKLIVRGELTTEDWTTIKSMTNLIEIDLSGALNTSIPYGQFQNRWAIEQIVLPAQVTTIGGYSIYGTGIKTIELPATLTTIGEYAFCKCTSLSDVHLPENLNFIGNDAFRECNLQSLFIPSALSEIRASVFYQNRNLTEITFSEGLTKIDDSAFSGCTALTSLTFPSTLIEIGYSAFSECSKLSSIHLNEGLQTLGYHSFYSTDLTEVILPSSLRVCEGSPFYSCSHLKKVYARSVIPATTDGYCPLSNVDMTDVVLYVPTWSLQEYQLASGWSSFLTVEVTDFMPQNVVLNKDFVFALRDELPDDYRPNVEMLWSNTNTTDAYGHNNYERGNLTVNSRSKLPVNDFSFYMSPFAKYYADENVQFGYSYDYYSTPYNPTALIVNGEMRAENVTLHLMNYRNRWQFISFPFDVNMSDIVPVDEATSWVIREYSGYNRANDQLDATWVNLTSEDVLQAGKGYIMQCYNANNSSNYVPVEFIVTPVKESVNRQALFLATDRTVALEEHLSEFEHNRSWNLIGNPYPSFFDTRFLDFEAPITVWNSYNQSYMAFSPVDDSYILNPGEAFFVQRPIDQESITFAATGRQNHRYARILADPITQPNLVAGRQRTVVNLTLSGQELSDRTRVVFNEDASEGYDLNRDASKFLSDNPQMPQLYTIGGQVKYAINERPEGNGIVELGMYIGQAGMYTLTVADDIPGTVVVEDRQTGLSTPITAETGYSFNAQAGELTGRFFLHFRLNQNTNAIEEVSTDKETEMPAYDLNGQRVNADTYKGVILRQGSKRVQQ